jgi:hypothetical protein
MYHIVGQSDGTVTVEGGNYTHERAVALLTQLSAWVTDNKPKRVVPDDNCVKIFAESVSWYGLASESGIKFRTKLGKGSLPIRILDENLGEFIFSLQEVPDDWRSFSSCSYGNVEAKRVYWLQDESCIRITSKYFEDLYDPAVDRVQYSANYFDIPVSQWREFKERMIVKLIDINAYFETTK